MKSDRTRFAIAKHPIFRDRLWCLGARWRRPNIGMMGFCLGRPTFQSSVAVYNHVRWSCISGFFWIIYFDNGQSIAVIMIMTKMCHTQNPLSKQHLNGCHHYRSIVWVKVNLCVPESYKRSENSDKTLLKQNQSNERTYGLNHMI